MSQEMTNEERQYVSVFGHAALEERRKKDFAINYRSSLRDEFAMAALTGMIACEYGAHADSQTWSKDAYEVADEMLKARSKS